jgi:hypothetical protein
MSTLAQITAAIDDDIRNKTPLVVKTEHADVEQLITDEMFPDSTELYFNGTAQISGAPNIVVPASVAANWKTDFRVYFEKIGNRVFYSGFISNNDRVLGTAFGGVTLATFPTTLYKPLPNRFSSSLMHKAISSPVILPNACITIFESGIKLYGTMPIGAIDFYIEGSYKVAN